MLSDIAQCVYILDECSDALRTALVASHLVAAVDVLALGAALRTRLRVRVEPPTRRVLLHRRLQRVHAVRLLEQRARLFVASLVLLDQRIQLTCSVHVLHCMDAAGFLHSMYCRVNCISANTVFNGNTVCNLEKRDCKPIMK